MAKILVVEDNDDIRLVVSSHLEHRGHTVVPAADGRAGLDAVAADRPDLVLMDLNLPVLDGWEAIRRLKADPQTRSLPVIALTAHLTSGDRDAGYESGADAFVSKPIDFAKLLTRIDELLAG